MPPKKRLTSLNYLLIVESSSKCSKIESYLGDRYKCIACNGHIRTIEGLKNIDVKRDYAVTYMIDPDKKAHVDKMHAIVAEYHKENIIIASDHDREGEAIAWHLCEVFDLPVSTTRRIVFHEITKPAILAAVANPGTIDMNLVRAQQARQVLDMLVGFKVSPVLWKHVGSSNSLSAGRCQTPALRLIYENELEAKKAQETSAIKHRIQASFFEHNLLFELDREFHTYEEVEAFLTSSKTHKHALEIGKSRVLIKSPPKPFNTATMLQAASNSFSMGAKDIMACCQTLYQMGHITYMRTESHKFSPVFTDVAAKYVADTWTKEHVNPELPFEDGANGSLAHEAIRVTNINMRDLTIISTANNNMASVEKVYKMIWQNTVQSCMSNATFNCLPLSVSSPTDAFYKHSIETVKFGGFLDAKDSKEAKGAKDLGKVAAAIVLQGLTGGRFISFNYIETIVGFTGRHSRFTEASLIDRLDELGIGRPSTFSMLVDVIQTRKYVDKTDVAGVKHECREYRLDQTEITIKKVEKMMGAEHKKLVIDPIGVAVIEFLLKHFIEFFSYDYTNVMEKRLDAVAAGAELWHDVCANCDKEINKLINAINHAEKKTYKVGEDYVLFFHKNGMLLKHKVDGIKGIKKGFKIDMGMLEQGEYTLEDLAEIDDIVLGMHNDSPVYLKSGKYGHYVEYTEDQDVKHISIDKKTDVNSFTFADFDNLLSGKTTDMRVLTPEMSVRTSKFGPYVFYKTTSMKKPKFVDLGLFKDDFMVCDKEELIKWVKKNA